MTARLAGLTLVLAAFAPGGARAQDPDQIEQGVADPGAYRFLEPQYYERFEAGAEAYRLLDVKAIHRQFEGQAYDLVVQTLPHGNDGRVHLVYPRGSYRQPVLCATTREGRVAWCSFQPLSDVKGYHYHTRIATDAEGRTLLAYFGTEPWGVFGRLFDRDGKVVWTTGVTDRREISDVNVIEWTGQGWLIAYSEFGHLALQLLDSRGAKRWAGEGAALRSHPRGDHTRPSLVQDSPRSVFVLWYEGDRTGRPAPFFAAQRIDPAGAPIWKAPIRVGDSPAFGMAVPRENRLSLAEDGRVKAELYKGIVSDVTIDVTEYVALISAAGEVTITSERRRTP